MNFKAYLSVVLVIILFSTKVELFSSDAVSSPETLINIVADVDDGRSLLAVDSVHVQVTQGLTGEAKFICQDVQWLSRTGEPQIPWKVITVILPPEVQL